MFSPAYDRIYQRLDNLIFQLLEYGFPVHPKTRTLCLNAGETLLCAAVPFPLRYSQESRPQLVVIGLPVHIADDPLSAVAEGTGRVLQELQFLKRVSSNSK